MWYAGSRRPPRGLDRRCEQEGGMARPTIVVSTGRSGSTLVSRMVREHPGGLSLSEFFVLLGESAFPAGSVTGPAFWKILSQPGENWRSVQRSGLRFDEVLYWPG